MELLSPAGSSEKLVYAITYGADAVYAAGKNYGLRSRSVNFSDSELEEAVEYVHNFGKKLYLTVNIFAHNRDLKGLDRYLSYLNGLAIDALIISDPGVYNLARTYAPSIPIHISTQANVTSWSSVRFWQAQGAKRIILARELSLEEISEIREKVPDIELEMFVHGAMCMSYSGRCLLSAFLNGRHANLGDCSQPCRWEYYLKEKSRPEEEFLISEDERGSYILNSRDLCLIKRIKEIKAAGVDSIKIEGRMKSLYYVANVTRTYREAIDRIQRGEDISESLSEELEKVSHRVYSEGFIEGLDSMSKQYYPSSAYIRTHQFLGEVLGWVHGCITVNVKAKFSLGEEIELICPTRINDQKFRVKKLYSEDGTQISFTKPNTIVKIGFDGELIEKGILRKEIVKE